MQSNHKDITHPSRSRRICRAVAVGAALLTVAGPLALASPAMASPQVASVADASSDAEVRAELEAIVASLRADGMLVESGGFHATQTGLAEGLATDFGKTVFDHLLTYQGGDGILDPLLEALGFGGDPIAESLDEIRSSIDALHDEIGGIAEKIDDLLDGQRKSDFYTAYGHAGDSAETLGMLMESVNGWVENGTTPTEANIAEMQTAVLLAIKSVGFNAANVTAGAIPLAMKAQPEALSDLEAYWTDVEQMRSSFQAAIAQGVVTLDLLNQFDESGTVASDLAVAVDRATGAVEDMYSYGVGIDQPGTRASALVRFDGSDTVYAPADHIGTDGQDWVDVSFNKQDLAAALQDLADRYDPDAHGGTTLEQYLGERGFDTRVTYLGTFRIDRVDAGYEWRYTPRATVGAIVDNRYTESVVPLGSQTSSKSEAQAAIDATKATIEGRTALRTLAADSGSTVDVDGPMTTTARFVHLRNEDTVYAPAIPTSGEGDGWVGIESTSSALKPVLKSMVAAFDPAANGGQTLQQYLEQRGLPTTAWYSDTAEVVRLDHSQDWNYQARVTRGSIVDNSYTEATIPLGEVAPFSSGKAAADSQVAELEQSVGTAPALYARTVEIDAGGHAATFDPAAIAQAAYGTSTVA